MKRITLKLDGSAIDARAFQHSLGAVLDMLKSVAGDDETVPTISGLRVSSAVATLAAAPEQVDVIGHGLDALRNGRQLPDGWTDKTLAGVRDLYKSVRRQGVSGVSLTANEKRVDIDQSLIEALDEIESSYRVSLGDVTGRLYRYSNRDRPTAAVEVESTGKPVHLDLPSELASVAAGLIEKRVLVRGFITYNPWTNLPKSMDVRGIEERTRRVGSVVSIDDVRGILRDVFPEDTDSVEWVRKQRDETA